MNRIDDIVTSKMMDDLLSGKIPSFNDLEYIEGLLLYAQHIKPDKSNIIKINGLYAEIIGKCFLYMIFYNNFYGDP